MMRSCEASGLPVEATSSSFSEVLPASKPCVDELALVNGLPTRAQAAFSSALGISPWQRVVKPFTKINSSTQVFDDGRTSLKELLVASTGKPDASQDRIIHLLAGPHQDTPEGQRMHDLIAGRMRAVLDEQRLVSLDTILALGD